MNKIIKNYPECIKDRIRFKALLLDFFPTEKLKVNLIMNGFDEGIIRAIDIANELDDLMYSRWVKRLIDNYGVSDENANWTVDYWFKEYGVDLCNKSYRERKVITENPKILTREEFLALTKKETSLAVNTVSIAKMKDGEKLRKSFVEVDLGNKKGIRLTDLTCSIIKEWSYEGEATIKYVGEYKGSCSKHALIIVMLYNANGELIGYDADETISDDFKGTGSYSDKIYVPNDEHISKVKVKVTVDPAMDF